MMLANAEFFGALHALSPSFICSDLLAIFKFANVRYFDEEMPSFEFVDFCRSLLMTMTPMFTQPSYTDTCDDDSAKMLFKAWSEKLTDLMLEYNV